MIHALDGPGGTIADSDKMLKIATSFYKDLLKQKIEKVLV